MECDIVDKWIGVCNRILKNICIYVESFSTQRKEGKKV